MTLKTHKKKRIEFIVEAALAPEVEKLLKALKVKCLVSSALESGQLASGPLLGGQISVAFAHLQFVTVVGEALAEEVLAKAHALLADYTAAILISDVEVLRDDHF